MGLPDLPGQNEDDGNFCVDNDNVINMEVTTDESENDSAEESEYLGYQPLSANEGLDTFDDDDGSETAQTTILENVPNSAMYQYNPELFNVDVWNAPRPDELSFEIDTAKAEQIVNVMAGINLPNSSVPAWAEGIPEERWKEALLQRIRQRHTTCTNDAGILEK
ncbi:male-enhanced antigen 1 [Toxorhynchites rutilus septentrionalis]|uniref:male-enhanced antigen 1 n=1 Tax=Toxorhynchites rutilus septentrionalis TaxID=329112 RepID=UPI002478BB13|nr:male-enhanced antigen 1 [Toxorhynchites rutilus septentrionalis]